MFKLKKPICIILAALMIIIVFSVAPVSANAEINPNFDYEVLEDGTVEITKYTGSDEELTIPSELYGYTVSRIGSMAFINCTSLSSVNISDGIKEIDMLAFYNCSNLGEITIPDSVFNINYSVFDGTAYYKNAANWEGDVLYIGKHLIKAKDRLSDSYKVKDGTVCVAGHSFQSCKYLTDIEFPDSLKGIGRMAFEACTALIGVEIPDNVVFLGDSVFCDCTNLKSAVLSKNITSISDQLFGYCDNLEIITIPDGVTSIGDYAFNSCLKLTEVTIPDGVDDIGRMAFYYCKKLKSIEIPDSVMSIGEDVFTYTAYYRNAANWTDNMLYLGKHFIRANEGISGDCSIQEGTLTVASRAFGYCSELTGVIIPETVKRIEKNTFDGCSALKKVTMPDSVTYIGDEAFYGCEKLTRITLPKSVVSIGEHALGYHYDEELYSRIDNVIFFGYSGTETESYALNNGFDFIGIDNGLDINSATVSGLNSLTYSGKDQTQTFTVNYGTAVLLEGTDYTVSYNNNKNAGTALVTITGIGYFADSSKTAAFTIKKAANTMSVKVKAITAKAKANKSFSKSKAFAISKAQGAVTFKKVSGDKRISIAKTGKIAVKKGLKKGRTYSLKIKVSAAGNTNYNKASKTAVVKIKVK